MNALTTQFKDKAINSIRATVIMNAGSIATADKLLRLVEDEGVTLQEFLEVTDGFEDENIAEGKAAKKAGKVKTEVSSSSGLPEGLAELETMLRSLKERSSDEKPDLDDVNVQKEMTCAGNGKAIKTALSACSEMEEKRGTSEGAELYDNWQRIVSETLKAWVRVWAKEHKASLARLEQLTAAT